MAKCPHCDENVIQADTEAITLSDEKMQSFRGLSYSCSACHYVLNVSIDPTSLEKDIVASVVEALRKH
jgi:hypothetical protein